MKKISLIILALCFSGIANAQSYTETVWVQIQSAYETNANNGYSMKYYVLGAMNMEEDNTWTFYFDSSYDYLLEGFCDEDCNDLDLYLYDMDGNEIDSDIEEDDFPIIYFSPSVSGQYQVEISMYACDVEPCYWGLAMFEQ